MKVFSWAMIRPRGGLKTECVRVCVCVCVGGGFGVPLYCGHEDHTRCPQIRAAGV